MIRNVRFIPASSQKVRARKKSSRNKGTHNKSDESAQPEPELALVSLQELAAQQDGFRHGMSKVVQSVWAGSAVDLSCKEMADLAHEISEMEYYKKQRDWTVNQLQDMDLTTGTSAILKRSVMVAITTKTRALLDQSLLSRLTFVGTERNWGEDVFDEQFWVTQAGSFFGVVPDCVGEVRLILKGSEVLFGIEHDCCPGEGLDQKLKFVQSATSADILRLVADPATKGKCFCAQLKGGELRCHPALLCPGSPCHGLRDVARLAVGFLSWRWKSSRNQT